MNCQGHLRVRRHEVPCRYCQIRVTFYNFFSFLVNICDQPVDPGPCFAKVSHWAFNQKAGRCKQFKYGGCFGNENNFDSKEKCYQRCPPTGNWLILVLIYFPFSCKLPPTSRNWSFSASRYSVHTGSFQRASLARGGERCTKWAVISHCGRSSSSTYFCGVRGRQVGSGFKVERSF